MKYSAILFILCASLPASAASTVWNFSAPAARLDAASGTATLTYHDPNAEGWGPLQTSFGKASALSLPALPGGDAEVMSFPACTQAQGFLLTHNAAANGVYGEIDSRVSNYTIVMDLLYPAASSARFRGLLQTDTANSADADFFLNPANGVGINSSYQGNVTADTWHRVVITVRAAPGEGHCQKYTDGLFVGGQGTTGGPLDGRWALGPEALLLTDENGETAAGFCSSIAFVDRALFPAEVAALGGPHAGGALTPGAAPPAPQPMVRRVGVIGHRGGAFNRAPDNTLAGIRAGIADGVQGIEVDTRITSDGVCVAFHDESVDRTTNGTGNVADMTLADLQLLDAGSWYDPSYAAERPPSLQQVFTEAKNKCIIFLDMKTGGQAAAIQAAVTASGFPLSDLWFWTTNEATALEIRGTIPTAKLMWGAPDAAWQTDPSYFTNLKANGVIGFSFSAGGGDVNPAFCAKAKAEGMIVEIFTILTPDAMRAAALSGVDYVENDYPSTMNSLQPAQTLAASGSYPPDGATDIPRDVILRWVTGTGATSRRVWFGTTPPGTDLGVGTSDLLSRKGLAYNTTYYWRVDEINPLGFVQPGPVWSFTTQPVPPTATLAGLWLFDRPDDIGHATIGTDLAVEGTSPDWVAVQEDDTGRSVSGVIRTIAGAGNHLRCTHGIGANGGGTYTNRYSFVCDVRTPPEARNSWRCLIQTSTTNGNDGDYFIRNSDDRLGVGALTYGPQIAAGEWTRLVFTVDLNAVTTSSVLRTWLNGTSGFAHATQGIDGRFALDTTFLFCADEDGENNPLEIGMLAMFNGPLSDDEIQALGGTLSEGLYPAPRLIPVQNGPSLQLNWGATPGYLLQRSTDLQTWSSLPATLGLGSWTEAIAPPKAYFRLAPR